MGRVSTGAVDNPVLVVVRFSIVPVVVSVLIGRIELLDVETNSPDVLLVTSTVVFCPLNVLSVLIGPVDVLEVLIGSLSSAEVEGCVVMILVTFCDIVVVLSVDLRVMLLSRVVDCTIVAGIVGCSAVLFKVVDISDSCFVVNPSFELLVDTEAVESSPTLVLPLLTTGNELVADGSVVVTVGCTIVGLGVGRRVAMTARLSLLRPWVMRRCDITNQLTTG